MRGVQERGRPRASVAGSGGGGAEADPRTLFDRWFDPCVDVAYRILHDPDEAADVVQHTFLGARTGAGGGPRRSTPFGTWALRTTRDEALSRRSRRWRSQPPDARAGDGSGARDEPAEVAWAAFAALGPSDASALDLHLRHDFSVADVAEALGVSANQAHQLLFRLKRRLGAAVRAWALWPQDGSGGAAAGPVCADLRAAVSASDVREFGSEAVQVVNQHTRTCRDCQRRQRLRSAPESMFAAVPVMPAGSLLRDRVLGALESAGAPLGTVPPDPAGPGAAAPSPPGGVPATPPGAVPPDSPAAGTPVSPPAGTPAALPRRQPRHGPPPSPPSPPVDPPALPRRQPPAAPAPPAAPSGPETVPDAPAAAHMAPRDADNGDDDRKDPPDAGRTRAASHLARPGTPGHDGTAPSDQDDHGAPSNHLARTGTPDGGQDDGPDGGTGRDGGAAGDAPPGADTPEEPSHDVGLAGAMAASDSFDPGTGHSVPGARQHNGVAPAGRHAGRDGVGAHGAAHAPAPGPQGRPYTYRRPRADRRQLVGVALAVVLVLGASLAIVGFTQGSTRSPTSSRDTPTTVPPDGSSTTTESDDAAGAPTTAAPPAGVPDAEMDTRDMTGDETGDETGQPEIDRFAATDQRLGTPCGDYQRRITLVWDSTGATSAQLDGQGAPTDPQPPSGQATACRDAGPPVTYTLTVSGPGGTTFRTITA